MTTKELIFSEIKRLIRDPNLCSTVERRIGGHTALLKLPAFLDTLPEEPVSDCHDLEEAAEAYSRQVSRGHNYRDLTCGFKAGAEWQARQLLKSSPLPEDTVIFQKGVEEGKRQMIEGAEEGEVQEFYRDEDGIHCCVSVGTDYKPGTIVYVITIPKEEGQ